MATLITNKEAAAILANVVFLPPPEFVSSSISICVSFSQTKVLTTPYRQRNKTNMPEKS